MVLSEYEELRAKKVAANCEKLKSLGLAGPSLISIPMRQASKRRPPPAKPSAPSRKSPRGAKLSASTVLGSSLSERALALRPAADYSRWEVAVFKSLSDKTSHRKSTANKFSPRWDCKSCHQHLTLSPDGLSAATTGPAGYGVVLCKRLPPPSSSLPPPPQRWRVLVTRVGVGGFAVGVVPASLKPPYKSLGKSKSGLGAYHSSGVLVCQGVEREFGATYGQGDVVEIVVRNCENKKRGQLREIAFFVNNKEVGVTPAVSGAMKGEQELLLACQPYMGGVATLCELRESEGSSSRNYLF